MLLSFFSENESVTRSVRAFIFLKFILIFLAICYLELPPWPDEAQYWAWSKSLQWGYYSKPPAIAYVLALFKSLGFQAQVALRLPSLVMMSLASWGFYRLVSASEKNLAKLQKTLVIAFSLCPISLIGHFSATTDVGMLSCCVWLWVFILRWERERDLYSWMAAWTCFTFGLLFKWAMLWMLPIVMSLYYLQRPKRNILQEHIIVLFALFLGLLPSIVWNFSHDFVTFRHVLGHNIAPSHHAFSLSKHLQYALEFWGAQLLLLGPLTAYFLFSFLKSPKGNLSKIFIDLRRITLTILFFVLIASFIKKLQGNWFIFLYPQLFILLHLQLKAFSKSNLEKKCRSLRSASFTYATVIALVLLFSHAQLSSWPFAVRYWPYKLNFFRQASAYKKVLDHLESLGFDPQKDLILSAKYQSIAALDYWYDLKYKTGTPRVLYWFNLHNSRQNHFSSYTLPKLKKNQRAYFLSIEHQDINTLKASQASITESLRLYFDKVQVLGTFPLFEAQNKVVKSVLIIELEGDSGERPKESDRY